MPACSVIAIQNKFQWAIAEEINLLFAERPSLEINVRHIFGSNILDKEESVAVSLLHGLG